jgi:hypothetical protein
MVRVISWIAFPDTLKSIHEEEHEKGGNEVDFVLVSCEFVDRIGFFSSLLKT